MRKNSQYDYQHRYVIKRAGEVMNLYRIISLETFIDLLHNKRERYVRPATWDDNYEGYLFRRIENPEDRRKIIEDMYYNVCPRNYEATINNLLKLEHGKYFVYGQCWSTLSDRINMQFKLKPLMSR